MPHILALDQISRYPRPAIGPFIYTGEYQRHVWKGAVLPDADALAEALNEALEFLKLRDDPYLILRAVKVLPAAPPPPAFTPTDSEPPPKRSGLRKPDAVLAL